MTLVFPRTRRPLASIVMPTYGRWELTWQALGAVVANTDEPYEMIVVDNASPDATAKRLVASTENVRIIPNRKNFGFALACNLGAANARGQYLVFLNSDAVTHEGWLAPLVETAGEDERNGAVGPCFLQPDGSVQEAGALLFAGGMTGAYGRGEVRRSPEFSSRPRVVDYISGACLLVKRRVFNAIGGFDPMWGTAYYEDVDLCLTLASRGYRTLYDPRSVVTHVFGWSAVKDEEMGRLMERNRSLLVERWRELLVARPEVRATQRCVVEARDAPASDRILVAGGKANARMRGVEVARAVAALCPDAHVAFVTVGAVTAGGPGISELPGSGVEVAAAPTDQITRWLRERRYHYDVAIAVSGAPADLVSTIRATQPQACFLVEAGETGGTANTVGADRVLAAPALHDSVVACLIEAGVSVSRMTRKELRLDTSGDLTTLDPDTEWRRDKEPA
jgi:GT2 family glycosyltransferase